MSNNNNNNNNNIEIVMFGNFSKVDEVDISSKNRDSFLIAVLFRELVFFV